mgnify:CR=1 FL=1
MIYYIFIQIRKEGIKNVMKYYNLNYADNKIYYGIKQVKLN